MSPAITMLTMQRRQVAALMEAQGASENTMRFFDHLFIADRHYPSVKALAYDLAVIPSTLTSRFYNLGLPSPKTILLRVTLWRMFVRMERDRMGFTAAALQEGASSHQAATRMCRLHFGIRPTEMAALVSADEFFRYFILNDLILPHVETWRHAEVLAA